MDKEKFTFKVIEKAVDDWDPLYLMADGKPSDYSNVIAKIAPLIKDKVFVCDFAETVRKIFVEEFGKDLFPFASNECQPLVYDINTAISNYKYEDKEIQVLHDGIIKTSVLKKRIEGFMHFLEMEFENNLYRSERLGIVHSDDEYMLFSLNRTFPDNAQIVCCNTCKFGNFSPYGGSDIFCFKSIDVEKFTDKLDVLDNFTDEVLNHRHDFNYYCDCYKPQNNTYLYNSYHYYAFHPEDKPYQLAYGDKDIYHNEKRWRYHSFITKFKEKLAMNQSEIMPDFEKYVKLKFSGADEAAKTIMKKFQAVLSEKSQSQQMRFVRSICSSCDEFVKAEIWTEIFSVPLCEYIFGELKPYANKKNAEFMLIKWIAKYALIYSEDKKLKLHYIEKALAACDNNDEELLKEKTYL